MPKFDRIVGNPPFRGNAQLHQLFFNLAVDIAKDGDGRVVFLQPATPYLNKKEKAGKFKPPEEADKQLRQQFFNLEDDIDVDDGKFKHHEKMKTNIKTYETSVWLFNPNAHFSNADIGNILAVTWLKKTKSGEKVKEVVYDFNGERKTFNNIALRDITIHGDEPQLVNSIRQKVNDYIIKHGSLNNVVGKREMPYLCRLGKVRGDIAGRNSQLSCDQPFYKNSFFTVVSKTKTLHVFRAEDYTADDEGSFCVYCDTHEEAENVYNYCTTKVAQFCLSLLKFTLNNHSGELKSVPLVNFNKKWTDEELGEELGLSIEERNFINSFIGDFYE